MYSAFSCYGAGQQGFAGARRPIQKHALRSENPQSLEDARVLQWQFDHFAHPCHFTFEAADIFVGHSRNAGRRLLALHDPDVGTLPDHHGTRGNRAHDLEVDRFGKGRHTHHAARDDRNTRQIFEHPVRRDGRRRSSHP